MTLFFAHACRSCGEPLRLFAPSEEEDHLEIDSATECLDSYPPLFCSASSCLKQKSFSVHSYRREGMCVQQMKTVERIVLPLFKQMLATQEKMHISFEEEIASEERTLYSSAYAEYLAYSSLGFKSLSQVQRLMDSLEFELELTKQELKQAAFKSLDPSISVKLASRINLISNGLEKLEETENSLKCSQLINQASDVIFELKLTEQMLLGPPPKNYFELVQMNGGITVSHYSKPLVESYQDIADQVSEEISLIADHKLFVTFAAKDELTNEYPRRSLYARLKILPEDLRIAILEQIISKPAENIQHLFTEHTSERDYEKCIALLLETYKKCILRAGDKRIDLTSAVKKNISKLEIFFNQVQNDMLDVANKFLKVRARRFRAQHPEIALYCNANRGESGAWQGLFKEAKEQMFVYLESERIEWKRAAIAFFLNILIYDWKEDTSPLLDVEEIDHFGFGVLEILVSFVQQFKASALEQLALFCNEVERMKRGELAKAKDAYIAEKVANRKELLHISGTAPEGTHLVRISVSTSSFLQDWQYIVLLCPVINLKQQSTPPLKQEDLALPKALERVAIEPRPLRFTSFVAIQRFQRELSLGKGKKEYRKQLQLELYESEEMTFFMPVVVNKIVVTDADAPEASPLNFFCYLPKSYKKTMRMNAVPKKKIGISSPLNPYARISNEAESDKDSDWNESS